MKPESGIRPVIPAPSDNVHNSAPTGFPCKRLLRVERYLARQVKAAHNLGLPVLERYYLVGFLALQLWLMEQIETHPERKEAATWIG